MQDKSVRFEGDPAYRKLWESIANRIGDNDQMFVSDLNALNDLAFRVDTHEWVAEQVRRYGDVAIVRGKIERAALHFSKTLFPPESRPMHLHVVSALTERWRALCQHPDAPGYVREPLGDRRKASNPQTRKMLWQDRAEFMQTDSAKLLASALIVSHLPIIERARHFMNDYLGTSPEEAYIWQEIYRLSYISLFSYDQEKRASFASYFTNQLKFAASLARRHVKSVVSSPSDKIFHEPCFTHTRAIDPLSDVADEMDRKTDNKNIRYIADKYLNGREKSFLFRYFGIDAEKPMNYTEIGQEQCIAYQNAQKVTKRAVKKFSDGYLTTYRNDPRVVLWQEKQDIVSGKTTAQSPEDEARAAREKAEADHAHAQATALYKRRLRQFFMDKEGQSIIWIELTRKYGIPVNKIQECMSELTPVPVKSRLSDTIRHNMHLALKHLGKEDSIPELDAVFDALRRHAGYNGRSAHRSGKIMPLNAHDPASLAR